MMGLLRSFVSVFLSFAPFWIEPSSAPRSLPPEAGAGGGGGPGGGGGGGGGGGAILLVYILK